MAAPKKTLFEMADLTLSSSSISGGTIQARIFWPPALCRPDAPGAAGSEATVQTVARKVGKAALPVRVKSCTYWQSSNSH